TVAALTMFGCLQIQGEPALAVLCLLIAGACLGFLLYNFNPARIFMGDCGSMFLGFVIAAVALAGTTRLASNTALALIVPAAVLVGEGGSDRSPARTFIGGTLLYKREIAQVGVDLALIPLAFLCANLLRFEGVIPGEIVRGMVVGLPYLLAAKALAMVFFQA